MSELLKKSEENRQAALKLWSVNNWYAPSVHCAYYSCIQLLIHILITSGGKTEKQIDEETKQTSSHRYYISEVKKLIQKKDAALVQKFSNKILDLKDYRIKSDYKNMEISSPDSELAINLSDNIIQTLKNVFKI